MHHARDMNVDHRRMHEVLVTACRPTPGNLVRRLISFEVASSSEGNCRALRRLPVQLVCQYFRPVEMHARGSNSGLCQQDASVALCPFPGGVEHLARWRGAQVGV